MLLWQKMTMLYLALAIGCVFWQPQIAFDSPTMLNLFDLNASNWNTTNSINYAGGVNSSIASATAQGNTQSGGVTNTAFFLIDALFSVIQFITAIFAVIFSPFIILASVAMPVEIKFFIGVPMVTMFLIGLIGFIRGTG
jgi:hypothetical protein